MVAARVCRMVVGLGHLQQTTVVSVAWQRSVRRGTTSEDGTCGNGIIGQLGLQRIAAGCLARLGYRCSASSEDGANDFSSLLTWWGMLLRG